MAPLPVGSLKLSIYFYWLARFVVFTIFGLANASSYNVCASTICETSAQMAVERASEREIAQTDDNDDDGKFWLKRRLWPSLFLASKLLIIHLAFLVLFLLLFLLRFIYLSICLPPTRSSRLHPHIIHCSAHSTPPPTPIRPREPINNQGP